MGETGIIGPDERVELIDGEILEMSPIGKEHAVTVRRINRLLHAGLDTKQYIIDQQNPVQINENSEPEPDLMVMPFREDLYADGVKPHDIRLLIEVADHPLKKDLRVKTALYARAGIPEVWIMDIKNKQLFQYADHQHGKYQQKNTCSGEDQITATQLPIQVKVKELIG